MSSPAANIIDLNAYGSQGAEPAARRVQELAERILAEEADNVANTPEGNRNDQLNRSGFALGQLVAGGVLSESRALDVLEQAADDAGMDGHEVRSTIRSGIESGKMNPRTLKDHDCAVRSPKEIEADRVASAKRKAEGEARIQQDRARAEAWAARFIELAGSVQRHDYLDAKKIKPGQAMGVIHADTVSAELGGFRVKGKKGELEGELLVYPLQRIGAKKFCSAQFIDGPGRKAFLPGKRTTCGAFWTPAALPSQDAENLTFLFGEGVATVLSASQAVHGGVPVAVMSDHNAEAVAKDFRRFYPRAKFIFLADIGKETGQPNEAFSKAARACRGFLVVPDFGPDREPGQTDFNDLHVLKGPDAVRECIEATLTAGQAEEVNLDDGSDLKPTEFTLDGFLGVGVLYVAGAHGVGKSSLLVPLVAVITGELEGVGVGAFLKRKVLYFAEDPDQILRVRYGLEKHCGLRRNGNFILRQTRRMSDAHLRALVASLVKEHTITGPNRYPVKPLIVFDTLSASFELQDENSNSEAAKFIAAIKESGGSTPVWLIGHIAKALLRADVEAMCGRGAGAWEADSQGTAFIFSEPDGAQDLRYLRTRKRRFEADFLEVRFATSLDQEVRQAPWGEVQTVRIRYGIPERSDEQTRKQDVQDVQTTKQAWQDARAKELILDFLQTEYAPVSKNDIEQYTTEHRSPRESARRALLELVRVGEVEMVEKYLARDGKARKNGYQLAATSPARFNA